MLLDVSRRNFHLTDRTGFRNWFAALTHVFDVHRQGFLHQLDSFLFGIRSRHTARKVGSIGAEIIRPSFNDDGVTHKSISNQPAAEYCSAFWDASRGPDARPPSQ